MCARVNGLSFQLASLQSQRPTFSENKDIPSLRVPHPLLDPVLHFLACHPAPLSLASKTQQLSSPTPSCLLSQAPLFSFPFTVTGWQESNTGPAPLAIFLAGSSYLCLSYYRWKTKTNKPFLNSSLSSAHRCEECGLWSHPDWVQIPVSPVLARRIDSLSRKLG